MSKLSSLRVLKDDIVELVCLLYQGSIPAKQQIAGYAAALHLGILSNSDRQEDNVDKGSRQNRSVTSG